MKVFAAFANKRGVLAVLISLLSVSPACADPYTNSGPVSASSLEALLARPQPAEKRTLHEGLKLTVPDPVAEIATFFCADPRNGSKIPIIPVKDLNNIAMAQPPGTDGTLSIVYSPRYIDLFEPATVLFWLSHECMHHQLGHTLEPYEPTQRPAQEDAADCSGIAALVTSTPAQIDAAQLHTIKTEVAKLLGGANYRSGADRAAYIDGCVVRALGANK